MAEERDENEFNETEGKAGQQPTGQSQQSEFGQQRGQPGEIQPPETMSGEGKFGGQTSTGDTDTDTLQPDRTAGNEASNNSGDQGFIGSQSGNAGTDATTEDDSDIETGQGSRLQDNDSDIEGSSGAA